MESILDRREGALPMIFCPMTNFKRPVVSCMCSCKKKDINWCHKIKQVAIEELDDVSKDLPEANLATWNERRDFFLATNLGDRKQHGDYDESVHGGAGLKSTAELDEQQTLDDAGVAIDPPAPEDESQTEPDDDEFERGPYDPEGDNNDDDTDASDTGPGGDEGLADAIAQAQDDDDDSGDGTKNDDEPQEEDGMAKKTCPHCDKKFKNARGLGIHLGRTHPDAETPAGIGVSKKPSKKSAASVSSRPAKKVGKKKRKSKKGESNGPWIILAADGTGVLVEDPAKLGESILDVAPEGLGEGEDARTRIFEIAKEVKIQTEVTFVDI